MYDFKYAYSITPLYVNTRIDFFCYWKTAFMIVKITLHKFDSNFKSYAEIVREIDQGVEIELLT